jgi:hypothetical protein
MGKSFNFADVTRQTLEVTLAPDTVLHVTTPPEHLIEKLAAASEAITQLGAGQNKEKVDASYSLAAELISCNLEGTQITADDLRTKYKIAPLVLAAFVAAYMDFINDFHTAKN